MNLKKDILERLHECADPKRAAHDENYIGTSFKTLGCSMPDIRNVAKPIFKQLETHPHHKRRDMMDKLWKAAKIYDLLHIPLLYLSQRKEEITHADWRVVKTWSEKIDNWAHSDSLSDLYAHLLERYPKLVLPTLRNWNTSKNPWKRRLSLTSLLYYSASRKHVVLSANEILPLVQKLLNDADPYVQKAVGWTLRECGNVYPEETKMFIHEHATELSSTAFSYATEKWPKKDKEPIKKMRKEFRKKK